MPTITTELTERHIILVTRATAGTSDLAHMIRDQGGRFVVMGAETEPGRRLVLSLNTGNKGIAVFLPGDPDSPDDLAEAVAECHRCWGEGKNVVVLSPAGQAGS